MGITIENVLQSIKELAEIQKKGSQEVNEKFKELAEARRKTEEAQRKTEEAQRKTEEARRKTEEARRKTEEDRRKTEEDRRKTEETRRKAEEEARRKAEEARRKAEKTRRKAEEEARKKSKAEFDQGIKEQKELNKKIQKSLDRFIGESGRQWGKFIETLASTGTIRLLKNRGIDVEYVVTRVKDESLRRRYEIDVLAINGLEMVAVEAKKHLTKKDVDIAKERFQVFKKYNKDAQRKTLYGAIAYLDCDEKVNLYAQRQGFFVFQVTGNSAIIENEVQFKPTHIEPII